MDKTLNKVEFHCHTSNSFDCKVDLMSRLKGYIKLGFTHLAITDHDKVLNGRDWNIIENQSEICIIPGIEVSTLVGHVILLNCKFKPPINSLAFLVLWSNIWGCEIYIPHPCRPGTGVLFEYIPNKMPTRYISWFFRRVKYIEAWNPRDVTRVKIPVDQKIFEAFANVTWTCASDSHFEDDIYENGCPLIGLDMGDQRIKNFLDQKIEVGKISPSFNLRFFLRYIKSAIKYAINY